MSVGSSVNGAARDDGPSSLLNGGGGLFYRKLHVIGRGRFGTVRLCERTDGELFALKTFRKLEIAKQRQWDPSTGGYRSMLEAVGNEIAVMKKLRHPNVVRLHAVIDDLAAERLHLVMDYVSGGTLMGVPHPGGRTWSALSEERARQRFRDILSGLAYLHKHGVVHQDLKPDNILLAADGRAMIADFGVARMLVPVGERRAAWRRDLEEEIGVISTLLQTLKPALAPGAALKPAAAPVTALIPADAPGTTLKPAAAPGTALTPVEAPGTTLQGAVVALEKPRAAAAPSRAPLKANAAIESSRDATANSRAGRTADGTAGGTADGAGAASADVRAWAVAEARATLRRASSALLLESSDGTPAFRAPETYVPGPHNGSQADVWSLGVCLFVMLFGRLPFPLAASEASLVDAPHATSPLPAKGGADDEDTGDKASARDEDTGDKASARDEDTGDKASARGSAAAEAAAEAAGLVSSTELLISIAAGARLGESDSDDDDDGGEVAILPDGTVTAIRDRPQDPASLATLASRSTSFLGAAATIERAIRTQPLRFPTAGVTSAAAASPSTGAVSADAVSGAAGARTDGGPPPTAPVSSLAKELLARILHKEPSQRATLAEMAGHPWVTRHGAEPLPLQYASARLRASPEEVHSAISVRTPGLDLAGGHCKAVATTAEPMLRRLRSLDDARSMVTAPARYQ
jgi:serine/threonine protein kinase